MLLLMTWERTACRVVAERKGEECKTLFKVKTNLAAAQTKGIPLFIWLLQD